MISIRQAFVSSLAALAFATAGAAVTSAPAQAGDPAAGKKAAAQCRNCHGIDGIATIPIAPHIAGESQVYLQVQLKNFRSGKRENEIMNVVAKNLSDEDIANLAAWYSSIKFSVEMPTD
ncbi:MAG: cytochrome c [Alphaproteobacteria bacterium]|nr:cytochrome c [Alphaproteobacteria bacterium]